MFLERSQVYYEILSPLEKNWSLNNTLKQPKMQVRKGFVSTSSLDGDWSKVYRESQKKNSKPP